MDANVAMWAAIVGFFLPLGIALVQQPKWGDTTRALVAFGIVLVAAFGTVYFQGKLDFQNWATSFLLIMTESIALYKGFWQKIGVTGGSGPNPVGPARN